MRLNRALAFYSGKQSRGWPPKRRMQQSARARATKIWRHTRGPKTPQGKAISCQNALKHGHCSASWRQLRKALSAYRRFLKLANTVFAIAHRTLLDYAPI